MKKDKDACRYSESTVKHRKNFPRTLNKFSGQWDKIDISYNEDSATFHCYDIDSKIFGNDNSNKVYDTSIANIKLLGLEYIEEVIDSLFEYAKYKDALQSATDNFILKQVMPDGSVKKISWLFAQDKDRDDLLARLHHHFEEVTSSKFSARFILMMYSSIKNKLMFKPIYVDEEGKYLTYFSSQFSDFKPGATYLNTIIEEIKVLYDYYLEYRDVFSVAQAKEFAYYLNEKNYGYGVEEDSPIVKDWRERYYFIVNNKLDKQFYLAIQKLCEFIEPFSTTSGQVVKFIDDKGVISKRHMKIHFILHHLESKIDYKRIYVKHQAINSVLTLTEQGNIYAVKGMPLFSNIVDGLISS